PTEPQDAFQVGEPHLDALAIMPSPLEGVCAGIRPGNITSVLVDTAWDPAQRGLRTASGFEFALGAVDQAAAIEDCIPSIDPACRRHPLPRRAGKCVGALVVAEVLP